jgi:biopolymer transport protein ExbD
MIIKRKRQFKAEVSTSSLNYIMFFLLLFFLNKQQITISVTKDKKYFIDSHQINFEDIEPLLKARIITLQEPTVILRMEYSLTVQDLADLLEIGTRLKVKMVMATNKTPGS